MINKAISNFLIGLILLVLVFGGADYILFYLLRVSNWFHLIGTISILFVFIVGLN